MQDNLEKWIKEAKRFYEQNEYEKAIEMYNKVLRSDPENIDALHEIGNIYYIKNMLPDALNAYTKYLAVCRSLGSYLELERKLIEKIGRVHFLEKNYSMAISSYLEALAIYNQLEPEGSEPEEGKFHILHTIGDIYFSNLRDYGQALAIYKRLLELSYKWNSKEVVADNLREIGTTLSKQKKFLEALEKFEEALDICTSENIVSGKALTQYEIGRIYFKQKEYKKAFPYLDGALKVFIDLADEEDFDDKDSFLNKTKRMWEAVKNELNRKSSNFTSEL